MVSIVALPAETSRPGKLLVSDPNVVSRTNRSDVPACPVSKGPSLQRVAVLGPVVLAVVVVAAVGLEVSNTYRPVVAQTSIS